MQKKFLLLIGLFVMQMAIMGPVGAVGTVQLKGSGSSFVDPVMQQWVGNFKKDSNGPVQISYDSVGSGSGKANLIAGTTQYAGSDAPLSASNIASLNGKVVLTMPDTIGGIVMIYNFPTNEITGNLNLTAAIIAGIYAGTITKWNDAAITAVNPGLTSTASIVPVHRQDKSGTSFAFSNFMSRSAPTVWTNGSTEDLSGLSGLGGLHNPGVAQKVSTTQESIGYVELNYAVGAKLSFASLQNRDGKWIPNTYKAVEDGVAAAAASASTSLPAGDGNWSTVSINWQTGATTYPISTFTYFMVYKDMTSNTNGLDLGTTKGAALVAFMHYIMTDKAQNVAVPLGYVALPQSVRDHNNQTMNLIKYNGNWQDYWNPTATTTSASSNSSSNKTSPGFEFLSLAGLLVAVSIVTVMKRKNNKN